MTDDRDSLGRAAAQMLAFLALAVGMAALGCRLFDTPTEKLGVADDIDRLQERDPDWVLIGNSMLHSRIDEAALSKISGWKAHKLSEGGTQSALWFLFLKNIVLKSGERPALVSVFFRSTDLTWAEFRVGGVKEGLVAALHGPEEPEWQQVLLNLNAPGDRLTRPIESWLAQVFPSKDLREKARRYMQTRAFSLSRFGAEADARERRAELNERFGLAHLRRDLGEDHAPSAEQKSPEYNADGERIDLGMYDEGPAVFDGSPEASFLPHMIALAQRHGMQLHFHRIKQRPDDGVARPESAAMQAYMNDLRAFVEGHGCHYTDESHDAALTLDMYADGDHIAGDGAIQKRYLKNFWERVKPIVSRAREARAAAAN